ncbi:MAG: ATP-binding protein [Pseudomonadota bacterium]|nr:MAG: hybrid sensor histidine kinase/response regulator [Pseudomonadota bacterium]
MNPNPGARSIQDTTVPPGGEMGERIHACNWADTPLGPMPAWPQGLRSAVSVLLQSPVPMAVLWGRDLILLYNDACARLLGSRHPAALGRPLAELTGSAEEGAVARLRSLFDACGQSRSAGVYVSLTSDSSARDEEPGFLCSPLTDDDGHIAGVLCVRADPAVRAAPEVAPSIAELRNALASLELDEERLYRLAAGTSHLIWTATTQGALQQITENGRRAMDWRALVHPDDLPALLAAWDRARGGGEPFEHRCRLRRSGTEGEWRMQIVRGRPLRDPRGRVQKWVGICVDAHEPADREDELRQARDEAERQRRAAELANHMKDEFLATVSHELRAPLNAISGWAGLLRQGRLDPAMVMRAAQTIENNVRAQAKLIDDLLDISRIASGKFRLELRELDPAVAVEAAVETTRPTAAAKDIRIETRIDRGVCRVTGDLQRLQQAVSNLLSNAVKFTPSGGLVTVELSVHDACAQIVVRDTGVGIPPAFLPHVFERFRQADRPVERRSRGLGLGLSIVRHIVELHGGFIRAESEGEGRGATFTIQLPCTAAQPSASRSSPESSRATSPPQSAPLQGLRLLTVDDEPDAAEMLKVLLEQYGARVTTAHSATDALRCLESERFDLLISDIGMPGVNGYELLERVRSACGAPNARDIPAIAVTGFARSEDRARALRAGYQEHVVKPVEPDKLAAAIMRVVARSSAQSVH